MDRAFGPQTVLVFVTWGAAPGWYELGLWPEEQLA
jgi:hypothetical protein